MLIIALFKHILKVKSIKGLKNYFIDEEGNVWSDMPWRYKKGLRKMKPWLNHRWGYYYVSLKTEKGKKHFKLHRLIAEAFIPNPDNKPCVDHINGITTDNRIENLRWCTQQENMNNPIAKKRRAETMKGKRASEETRLKMRRSSSKKKSVIQYTKDYVFVAEYESAKEAERQTGIWQSNISLCCKGKVKSAGGFIWRYPA